MAVWVNKEECAGCESCLEACLVGSISMRDGVAFISGTCTGCGACVGSCPQNAIKTDAAPKKQDISRFKDVWVIAELKGGAIRPCTFELLGCGKGLAAALGQQLCAVVAGKDARAHANGMAEGGADVVYIIDDPELDEGMVIPHARVLGDAIRERMPAVVLFSATPFGRELAPRISRRLGVGLTADCTELGIDGSTKHLLQTRPAWGGNLMACIFSPDTRPQMSTVRPGVMKALPREPGRKARVMDLPVKAAPKDFRLKLLELKKLVHKRVDLSEAKMIVAGGNGVGSREGFKMLEELAAVLGAEVAGTRITVEEGWITQDRQVGQTGQSVCPDLYIACGISGAIQHRSGMAGAKTIVAINTDPAAPIFSIADIAIVDDLHKVVPELINVLKGAGI
jgi:electron transfer flavoprotein alpha subunit/NAD-dependent dihydropyrimidine dehydrogenase PreA subunit